MADPKSDPKSDPYSIERSAARIRVYFWPNLMTAGNLFCGFLALTKIVEADIASPTFSTTIRTAMYFILLACVFDLLDGRLARMGGNESPFGREFDSLADIISFGAAPAFLVHRIVLRDVFHDWGEIGWLIAAVYLICGALRLARFNCLAELPAVKKSDEFLGFPIPMAAGLVASLSNFLLWFDEKNFMTGWWRYVLPVMMVFLSVMMVSEVKYPAFKTVNLRTRRTFTKLVSATLFIGCLFVLRNSVLPWLLPLIFTAYLVYGFIRPHISKKMRREIEEELDEDDDEFGINPDQTVL